MTGTAPTLNKAKVSAKNSIPRSDHEDGPHTARDAARAPSRGAAQSL